MKPEKGSVEWFDDERRGITELARAIDSFASASRALSKFSRYNEFLDDDLKSSLFSSAVVNYARPFTPNRNTDVYKHTLPKKSVASEHGYSGVMHQHIMDLRNKIIAHHDSDYVGASIVYHYLRLKSDISDKHIVRGGSAITQSVNFPSSTEICLGLQSHIKAVLEAAGKSLKSKFQEYLGATNVHWDNFVTSRSKYGDNSIKWGESRFPDMSKPVELLPIEAIKIDEWIKKPKLSVSEDGYAYRDLSLTIGISFDVEIIGSDGIPFRLISHDSREPPEIVVSQQPHE